MIPVSRRTIASAIACWRSVGQRVEVEVAELLRGGAGPDDLGEQRDHERQHAVEVVQAVWRLVAGEDEQEPRAAAWRTTATWATRSAYQNPTVGSLRSQAIPPQTPATRLAAITADPDDEVDVPARPRQLTTLSPSMPPRRVGIPLADAENHYVATLPQSGYITADEPCFRATSPCSSSPASGVDRGRRPSRCSTR